MKIVDKFRYSIFIILKNKNRFWFSIFLSFILSLFLIMLLSVGVIYSKNVKDTYYNYLKNNRNVIVCNVKNHEDIISETENLFDYYLINNGTISYVYINNDSMDCLKQEYNVQILPYDDYVLIPYNFKDQFEIGNSYDYNGVSFNVLGYYDGSNKIIADYNYYKGIIEFNSLELHFSYVNDDNRNKIKKINSIYKDLSNLYGEDNVYCSILNLKNRLDKKISILNTILGIVSVITMVLVTSSIISICHYSLSCNKNLLSIFKVYGIKRNDFVGIIILVISICSFVGTTFATIVSLFLRNVKLYFADKIIMGFANDLYFSSSFTCNYYSCWFVPILALFICLCGIFFYYKTIIKYYFSLEAIDLMKEGANNE